MKKRIAISLLLLIVIFMCGGCETYYKKEEIKRPQYNYSYDYDIPKPQPSEEDETNIIVYITQYGKRYHKGYCSHAPNAYSYISIKSARRKGYTACYYCC